MKAHGLNPRIKKSPFFEKAVEYGATEFHPYNGMWMPVGYDSPVNEYWNVLERASLWDVGVQKCVEIAGPDAEAFMQLLTPRDITTIEPGRCAYVFLTNQDGGVLNDPVMLRIADDRFWLSTADSDMYLWAKGVSAFSGHEVEITTPHVYPMQLQGPRSAEIMVDVFGGRSSTFVTTRGCAARSTASMSSSRVPVTAPSSATRCISSAKRAVANSGRS